MQRFADGELGDLYYEACHATVRRQSTRAAHDEGRAAADGEAATRKAMGRVTHLAEQAIRDGNLSRGMQRILSQLNPPLTQSDPHFIEEYGKKVYADEPEDLSLLQDWERRYEELHGDTSDAASFRLGSFTPSGQDHEVDTLDYVVAHLDPSAAGGVSGWTNKTLRRMGSTAFLRPVIELFFSADEDATFDPGDDFHTAVHRALITCRAHALNKERDAAKLGPS